jgi:hypothetical protein
MDSCLNRRRSRFGNRRSSRECPAAEEAQGVRSARACAEDATEQAGGAKVLAYWEREQDGGVIYEMDVDVEGHGKGVLIRPDGSVLAVQEEVSFDKLDAGVQSGIKQRAGEGKIDKVFSVTQDGKIVRYVAVVDKAGQKGKVVVGPTGEAPAEAKAPSP